MLELEVPLLLARGLELDDSLGIGRINPVNREGAIPGVDQIQPLDRAADVGQEREGPVRFAARDRSRRL